MKNKKILVVDDESVNIHLLGNILNPIYTVIVSNYGEDALAKAHIQSPDLIVLDVMMPIMGGIEVCRRLKDNPKTTNIPVIFLSANDSDRFVKGGFELGAVDYIVKPFVPEYLLEKVEQYA